METGLDGVVVGVDVGVDVLVGVSGACAGTGVVGSRVGKGVVIPSVAWELVGVAVGAALDFGSDLAPAAFMIAPAIVQVPVACLFFYLRVNV